MKMVNAIDACEKWLRDYLADGPKDSRETRVASPFGWVTVHRAANNLSVVSTASGNRRRLWSLPEENNDDK